ncbi:MAG: hypothetical protein AAFN09_03675 [Pseudomonadota bacterium]
MSSVENDREHVNSEPYDLWDRLDTIVALLRGSPYDHEAQGDFSIADQDELEMVTEHLKEELPEKFRKLVFSGYFWRASEQREQGERLARILNTHKAIGSSDLDKSEQLLPTFSLVEEDKARVMRLCQQMRKIIFGSAVFDQPHKRRLLNRIAAIEKQISQPKGLFDVILGGVNDFGETLGKFGTDIKPLTDRMNEVAGIARRNSEEYQQIPAPEEIQKLPPPGQDGKKGGN